MKSILIIAPYNSFLRLTTEECFTVDYIRQLGETAKVSVIINERVQENQPEIKDLFNDKNVTIYNIFSEDNLNAGFYKFLLNNINAYLRYCYYKKQIAIKADAVFVKYYNLLKKLLRVQIFDVIVLQSGSSCNAVDLIRQFDKKVTLIYVATFSKKDSPTAFKDINALVAPCNDYLKAIKKKNNVEIKGIVIDGSDKKNVARSIADFIEAQPANIKSWKMKIHFLTFVSSNFKTTLSRIKTEAEDSGFFDTITCLSELDLPMQYRIEHKVNQQSRGFGYWIWKSYIIRELLSKINDGDVLVYADGGCSINPEGRKRFYDYIEMLLQSKISILSFQTLYPEKQYTKGDLFKYLDVQKKEDITNSGQFMATTFLIRKDRNSEDLIQRWYSICHNHKNLIDDSASSYPNDPEFIAHRHDQSIFSILIKLYGSIGLSNEIDFYNWNENKYFPIHARRWKS